MEALEQKDKLTMTKKELDRIVIINRLVRKEITQEEAAKIARVSTRQIRRIFKRHCAYGDEGMISKRFSCNRAFSQEFKEKVVAIVLIKYPDFKPSFAAEKLLEYDNIKINRETLRHWMMEANLWKGKQRKSARIHQSRMRRSRMGELVQIDGSPHDWFEGRAPKCCLLVLIDDASSKIMHMRFEAAETTMGYFRAIKTYLLTYGLPISFYSDKHGIFKVNQPNKVDGLIGTTQFQRAMNELNIEIIYAHSPQAKGRVERANQTMQDRLIKEMRLRGISNVIDANIYISEFLEKHNAKFAIVPLEPEDSHRVLGNLQDELERILSHQTTRKLSKNLEFNYNNITYKILRYGTGYSFRHAQVQVSENVDGIVNVYRGKEKLKYEAINHLRQKIEVSDKKELNAILDNRIFAMRANLNQVKELAC